MSKPISFGFGKSKTSAAPAKPNISIPTRKPAPTKSRPGTTLDDDSDNEEEQAPKHESVTGFSSSGVILSQPAQDKSERVIKNPGNSNWRKRGRGGKNLLPEEVQAARNGDVVMVERDEVSKESGLQFAEPGADGKTAINGEAAATDKRTQEAAPAKPLTDDEVALQALLDDGSGKPKSNAVIEQVGNNRLSARDETEDFRTDVASRPDSSTLEDYAAMPVEEFGLAMLRGMGLKRRANGEVINLNGDKADENHPRKVRKQEGFLGIGAKPAPGADIELGAWGKADMRKNNRGEGFFTPLMRENKVTGERITEEELQKRMKDSKSRKGEDDWRERRDRNLERSGRDKTGEQKALTKNGDGYRDQMNEFSRRQTSSRRRDRDEDDDDSSRSRREREKEDREYDSSRSRRERSRSRDRRRRGADDDSTEKDDYDHDSRRRDRHRDKHRDDERYDSTSSKRSGHRERDQNRDRDRDRVRERESGRR